MRHKSRLLAICVAGASGLAAQSTSAPVISYDLTVDGGQLARAVSIAGLGRHAFFGDGRLLLGYGVRASYYFGDGIKYRPAGARNVPAGVYDTLTIGTSRVIALNVSAHAAVRVAGPLELGMNIDIVGVGAGGSASGSYRTSGTASPVSVSASPASFNLFQYGSKDRGSLNSEFYAAWRATPAWTVRGGLAHFLAEYQANRQLNSNTDRFRIYKNLGFLGLRWTPR